jgi:DNA-binding CsgD family transcriptional regulator
VDLTHREADLVFSIMRELTGEFAHEEVRKRVGQWLLELLGADYFASYVWDEDSRSFKSGVNINMTQQNLERYEQYYQYHDPITPTLQRRRRATPVSAIMAHGRLKQTEFFNDFLYRDGLYYGINYFAYDRGENIGDVRIWRSRRKEDFGSRDAALINAIAPSFVNALVRANRLARSAPSPRFAQRAADWGLTSREAEIADMLVVGLTDEDICASLHISKPTLRSHIGAVFRKVGAQRRSQLSHLLTERNHHL